MRLVKLSFLNMVSKPLNTLLSVLLLALSVSLVCVGFHLKKQVSGKIDQNLKNIDMVVGAKGSPLQLVLSSVLHIDAPTGNIDYAEAKKINKNPLVAKTVPISYGDSYKGFRIVGTTPDFLKLYGGSLKAGTLFEEPLQVVLGSTISKKLDLQVNDTFVSAHGLTENTLEVHDTHKLIVVGILAETQSVLDNLIVTPLETIWQVHDHQDNHDDHSQNESHDQSDTTDKTNEELHPKEITALLVQFRNPLAQLQLPRQINTNTAMQAALPKYELEKLINFTGIGAEMVDWIAAAILIISIFSIFISLYRMVRERRYELALMRVYGAQKLQLFGIVLIEGVLLAILGFAFGLLLARLGLYFFSEGLQQRLKFDIGTFGNILAEEGYLFIGITALVLVATFLATIPLLKMNVSKILTDEG